MIDNILNQIEQLREHEAYYQQVYGVKYIVKGLEYHYSRFSSVVSDGDDEWFHELIAYLNRLGQMYYFFKSDFMSVEDKDIPVIKRLIPFRMKYSAHRSVDDPKKRDGDDLVMMDVSIPNVHYIKHRQELSGGNEFGQDKKTRGICIPRINEQGNRDDAVFLLTMSMGKF